MTRADVVLGTVFLILLLAAYAIAGMVDAEANDAWIGAWEEQNGVVSCRQ